MSEWQPIETAPRNTIIECKFTDSGPIETVKTCRRGCCVYDLDFGYTLVPPKLWRLPEPPK